MKGGSIETLKQQLCCTVNGSFYCMKQCSATLPGGQEGLQCPKELRLERFVRKPISDRFPSVGPEARSLYRRQRQRFVQRVGVLLRSGSEEP